MKHGFWMLGAISLVLACGGKVEIQSVGAGAGDASGGGGATTVGVGAGATTAGTGAGGAVGVGGATTGGGGAATGAEVACGAVVCGAPDVCLICDAADTQLPKKCVEPFANDCDTWPALLLSCDDDGDCASGEQCTIVEGSVGTYAQCSPPPACQQDCSCDFSVPKLCDSLADCPACATACEPYQQPGNPGAPEFPVKVCSW